MTDKEIKHFNKGVVFGRLSDLVIKTSENNKKYMQLHLECPNDLHGDTRVYGRLWGDDRVEQLLGALKKDGKLMKGTGLRLEGFFSQYDGEDGQRLNNFTFFKWKPFTGAEYRAAFILTGQIEDAYETEEGEGAIHLHIVRKGANEQDVEEDFLVFTEDKDDILELQQGQIVHLKGLISEKGEEDYFGSTSGIFKAYVKEIKVLQVEEVVRES